LHEVIYKRRDDGRLGWDAMPIRAQESLQKWEWDLDADRATGMWQLPETGGQLVMIPFERSMLFRTTVAKRNPEGRSVLRSAYLSWYRKTNIENIESIGIERDLAGFPVLYVPAEWTYSDASTDQQALYNQAKQTVRRIRRDEQEGLVLPMILGGEDNKQQMLKLELLSAGGDRQFDTNAVVMRHSRGIASVLLADFILLGHEGTGSYSLSEDKTDLFEYALTAYLDLIAEQFNTVAIPDLLRLNAIEGRCKLTHSNVDRPDIQKIGDFVERMVGSAVFSPDENLETYMRELANIPQAASAKEEV
jgi:hypothetical protein